MTSFSHMRIFTILFTLILITNNREQDASRPKRSVLGDVRRITQKRGADGRDIVEIEHTDGTETILAFDKVS